MIMNLNEDALDAFEDAIDCAVDEAAVEDEMKKLTDSSDKYDDEELEDEIDDAIDTDIDYSGDTPDADQVDIDADDLVAAARDIMYNPFEDDDLIDDAIGDTDSDYAYELGANDDDEEAIIQSKM